MAATRFTCTSDGVVIAILFAATWSALLPVAESQSDSWALLLNNLEDNFLFEHGGPPVLANCSDLGSMTGSYNFTWIVGEGSCEQPGSTLPQASAFPSAQSGRSAVLQVPTSGLSLARYYFIKCNAVKVSKTISQCKEFRLYGRTPAANSVGLNVTTSSGVTSVPCDYLVLPTDVTVDVVWTRAGKVVPAQQQQTSVIQSPAGATSMVVNNLTLSNTPDAGGLYTCTIDSPDYGRLAKQSVSVLRAAVAVFVMLTEKVDGSAGKMTRVSATCEGYGYPLPTVLLTKGAFIFSENGSSELLDGGIRTNYTFLQPRMDDSLEVASYGCKATNELGTFTAYYNPPPTTASTLTPSSVRETAAFSGSPASFWKSAMPWSQASLIGFVATSLRLS